MKPITECRLCHSSSLVPILDLGTQALTGVFPRPDEDVPEGPLQLVKCHGPQDSCGLVQLAHDGDLAAMYGEGYGYRSGLNASMVRHLARTVTGLIVLRPLAAEDVVLDIGSNDGTTLAQYPLSITRIGIDPTAAAFAPFYPPGARVAAEFFSADVFHRLAEGKKAAIVTSIAMFYDLPDPTAFVRDVSSVLADDGIWHFEQSYLPSMLGANAYDTVCHEHLEYYGLRQIQRMTSESGLGIVAVRTNDINGGSIAITAAKGQPDHPIVSEMIAQEIRSGLHELAVYEDFRARVEAHQHTFRAHLERLHAKKKVVYGLGASTKGNVLLQYAGIDARLLPAIGEVNTTKIGRVTPGTRIPIISEEGVRRENPDVMVVLPWHFRDAFITREAAFLARGGSLLFPLPTFDTVSENRS